MLKVVVESFEPSSRHLFAKGDECYVRASLHRPGMFARTHKAVYQGSPMTWNEILTLPDFADRLHISLVSSSRKTAKASIFLGQVVGSRDIKILDEDSLVFGMLSVRLCRREEETDVPRCPACIVLSCVDQKKIRASLSASGQSTDIEQEDSSLRSLSVDVDVLDLAAHADSRVYTFSIPCSTLQNKAYRWPMKCTATGSVLEIEANVRVLCGDDRPHRRTIAPSPPSITDNKQRRYFVRPGGKISDSHTLLDALPNVRTRPIRGILHLVAIIDKGAEETPFFVTFMDKTLKVSTRQAKIPFNWAQFCGMNPPWICIHTGEQKRVTYFPLDALLQLEGKTVVKIPSSSARLVVSVATMAHTEPLPSGWIHASYWHVQMHRELDACNEPFRLNFSLTANVLGTQTNDQTGVLSSHGRRFDVPGCFSSHGQIRWDIAQAVDGVLIATTGQESGMWLRVDVQKERAEGNSKSFVGIGVAWVPVDSLTEKPVDLRLAVYEDVENTALRIAELTMRVHLVPDTTLIAKTVLPVAHLTKPDKVFEAHFSAARYLHHPKCKGRLDAFVECSFFSHPRVSRGPIAFHGTETHPSWQGRSLLLDLPLDVASRLDTAEQDLPDVFDSLVLLVKVRSSTINSSDDEIGRTSIGLASVLYPPKNDTWFSIFDSAGTERGEICLAYARVVERHRKCEGGLVSVSLPRVHFDSNKVRKYRPSFVRVVGEREQNFKCFELPKRLALPVSSGREDYKLDLLGENSKTTSAVTSLDLNTTVKQLLTAPAGTIVRDELQSLNELLLGVTAKMETLYVPHSRGLLRLTPSYVELDTPAETLEDQQPNQSTSPRLFIRVATNGDHGRTKTSYCGVAAWRKPPRKGDADSVALCVDTRYDFVASPSLPTSARPIEAPMLQFSILDERPIWRNRVAVGTVPLLPLLTAFSEFSFDLFDPVTRAPRGRASVKAEYVRLCVDEVPGLSRCAALAVLKRTLSEVDTAADFEKMLANKESQVRNAYQKLCPGIRDDELSELMSRIQKMFFPDQSHSYAWRELFTTAAICPNVHFMRDLLHPSQNSWFPGNKIRQREGSERVTVSFVINFCALTPSTLKESDALDCVKRVVVECLSHISRFVVSGTKVTCFASTFSSLEARSFVAVLKQTRSQLRSRLWISFGETRLSDLAIVSRKKKKKKTKVCDVPRNSEATCREAHRDFHIRDSQNTRRKLRISTTTAHAISAALLSRQQRQKSTRESPPDPSVAHIRFERRKVRKLVHMIQESRDRARFEAKAARDELAEAEEKLRQNERPLCASAVREGAALEAARQERKIKSLQNDIDELEAQVTASRNQAHGARVQEEIAKVEMERAVALRHVVESKECAATVELERRVTRDAVVSAHRLARATAQEIRLECARRVRAEYEEDERRRERAAMRIQQHLLRPRLARQITKRAREDYDAVYRGVLACVRLRRQNRKRRRFSAAVVKVQAIQRARMAWKRMHETTKSAGFVASKWRAWRRSKDDATDGSENSTGTTEERKQDILEASRARRRSRRERKEAALVAHRATLSLSSSPTSRDPLTRGQDERILLRKDRGLVLITYVFVRAVRRRLAFAIAHWRRTTTTGIADETDLAQRLSEAVERGLEEATVTEKLCREILLEIVTEAGGAGDENEQNSYDRLAREIVSNTMNLVLFEECDEEVDQVSSAHEDTTEARDTTPSNWSSPTIYSQRGSSSPPGLVLFEEDSSSSSSYSPRDLGIVS